MKNIITLLKKELWNSDVYGIILLLFGIITQVIAYYYTGSNIISIISGIAGIFSVVLCSQKKYSYFIFAWIQMFTYTYLALQEKLYGEVGENIFYMFTTLIGMYIWYKNYKCNNTEAEVETKCLSKNEYISVWIFNITFIILLYYWFIHTNDSQPFMDAITTVPAIIAQILMICRYREQWVFWFIIDVASIWMWSVANDWVMVIQFIFWTINCIYGFIKWSK